MKPPIPRTSWFAKASPAAFPSTKVEDEGEQSVNNGLANEYTLSKLGQIFLTGGVYLMRDENFEDLLLT